MEGIYVARMKTIQTRINAIVKEKIKQEAKNLNIPNGVYLRCICLNAKIDSSIDVQSCLEKVWTGELEWIQARVTEEEYKEVVKKAKALNLSNPDFLRLVCATTKIEVVSAAAYKEKK